LWQSLSFFPVGVFGAFAVQRWAGAGGVSPPPSPRRDSGMNEIGRMGMQGGGRLGSRRSNPIEIRNHLRYAYFEHTSKMLFFLTIGSFM